MKNITARNFNLKATIESGQVFRWEFVNGYYYIVVGDAILKLQQKGSKLFYETSKPFDVRRYFCLDVPYAAIIRSISKDAYVKKAVAANYGLRLIRQPAWECLASFICSSYSNIQRIRKNLNSIAEMFGRRISLGNYETFSFPPPQKIVSSGLKKCGLGYRCSYLLETAEIVARNPKLLENIKKLPYEQAKQQLMGLPGVGAKVADCVLLFAYGKTEAFPVDVWVKRAMKHYVSGSEKKIAEFARSYFGKYAGYAQQFLYHYFRKSSKP
ncbi:MAG: DNA glycosylase [Candidatus Woesearchaeota archaeon]